MQKKKITQADRQQQFFEFLFSDKAPDEYITIFALHKSVKINDTQKLSTTKHYKTISGAIEYCNRLKYNWDIYVSLATTDGAGRARDNLISRNVIAFDFDADAKGDKFNYKDVMHIMKQSGIYYHMMVSSGNGFHVYLKTDRTSDIDRLIQINKALADKIGNVDANALKTTQVLRVPNTFNHKDKRKSVNLIWLSDKVINYNLDKLDKKYVFDTELEETNLKYISKKYMPPCIESILAGVSKGERNFCLGRLTKWLQMQNNSQAQALAIVKEWNAKNKPAMAEASLEYHFNEYWNGDYLLMGCKSADSSIQAILSKYCNQYECNKQDKFEIVYKDGTELISYSYKELDQIRFKKGREIMINGNHIVIITILRQFGEGLNYKQLEQELTSAITDKCCMSRATIYKVLDELSDLGIIEKIAGNRKTIPTLYKIVDAEVVSQQHLTINHHAVRRYIDGAVGQSALRVYVYMKYRLSKGENVVQAELANDLGLSQPRLNQCMQELERARYVRSTLDFSINPLGACRYEFM